jgi:hypothetical protein
MENEAGDGFAQSGDQPIADGGESRRFSVEVAARYDARSSESHDTDHVLGARAQSALV